MGDLTGMPIGIFASFIETGVELVKPASMLIVEQSMLDFRVKTAIKLLQLLANYLHSHEMWSIISSFSAALRQNNYSELIFRLKF